MANGWGGKRARAGRKPTYFVRTRAQLLAQAVNPEDWIKILKHVKEIAISAGPDALRAASLLMHYQFGDVSESVDHFIERKMATSMTFHTLAVNAESVPLDSEAVDPLAESAESQSGDLSSDDFVLGVASETPDLKET